MDARLSAGQQCRLLCSHIFDSNTEVARITMTFGFDNHRLVNFKSVPTLEKSVTTLDVVVCYVIGDT